ncbi:hypothetical protein ABEB36_010690 [Hypothenemus hampei]|uniref:Peptidase A2 domain-containing protein n=1 Tax=Hypothenemus hampei TaxID=57062 RepID=A0ABD1ECR6_HYPHA
MEFANTTVGNARGQTIEPIRPQFIQPPSFRPAYHSPTAFLLGYERAACGNGWNDGLKISHLGSYLEGTAVRWYHNYLLDPANDTKTWDEVKRDFKNEFMEVQWGSLSNDFYYKQQGYTEDIGRYYYDLRNLADELNQNMPFEEFRAQFEKGLHPRFRPNYYMLREKEMSQAMLKNVVEKLSMWMGSFGGPYTFEPHCEPPDSWNATSAFRGYGRSSNTSHGYTGPSGNDTWKNNNGSSASRGFQRDNFNSTQRRNNGFRAINSNHSGSKILSVKGLINSKYMDIVLDTGAERSIIREDMVTSVDSLTNKVNLVGAGGSRLLVTGTHEANIEFGSVKVGATLLVARHLARPIILGNDFLETTTAIINYRNKTINLEFNGQEVEFPFTRLRRYGSVRQPGFLNNQKQRTDTNSVQQPLRKCQISTGSKTIGRADNEVKLRCPQDYKLLPNRSVEVLFASEEIPFPDHDH